MQRNWSIGGPGWNWPDDVDKTGTDNRGAYRYLPIRQVDARGYSWEVARVFADECDEDMMDDARLMAAAPALLAAAQEMADIIDSFVEGGADAYRGVIGKAEGRAE